ncbi:hypothetical protein CIL05_00490 [Virgibacillus profundi]|uniref:Uncharacterized protein n=1 Tax=Virgibacillus profundi TaxID=2024555 RepID=A0A2A2IJ92_9BACI|nr:hypothetical protein CIL05_00490 [Virgibacillus profundi]PXY55355.1 hypothetical protein CIT14_00490 [Virgibacillus profundi]
MRPRSAEHEETHQPPAESEVYFRSGSLLSISVYKRIFTVSHFISTTAQITTSHFDGTNPWCSPKSLWWDEQCAVPIIRKQLYTKEKGTQVFLDARGKRSN